MVAIYLLDIHASKYINVEHHVFPVSVDASNLALECAIETARVDLLVLGEIIVFNVFLELFLAQVIIVHSMDLLTAARACGC